MKSALVLGAGGLIGNKACELLKDKGYEYVVGVDLNYPKYNTSKADSFKIRDLRYYHSFVNIRSNYDEIYQFAADMGGAGFVFTGEHDADILNNSALINLNLLKSLQEINFKGKVFYSSSACMYPQEIQEHTESEALAEHMAYPGNPDSEYGWEKLFSERLYLAYARNYGINIRIARFHNIFGINSCYNNGREKYPAAVSYKIANAKNGDTISIWGDGLQTRSYLNVDECLNCVFKLMDSDVNIPLNIGSDEMISCNDLAKMVIEISGKDLKIEHDLTKPQGVRGRNSDNTLIAEKLGYAPQQNLRVEMTKLYNWINKQVNG